MKKKKIQFKAKFVLALVCSISLTTPSIQAGGGDNVHQKGKKRDFLKSDQDHKEQSHQESTSQSDQCFRSYLRQVRESIKRMGFVDTGVNRFEFKKKKFPLPPHTEIRGRESAHWDLPVEGSADAARENATLWELLQSQDSDQHAQAKNMILDLLAEELPWDPSAGLTVEARKEMLDGNVENFVRKFSGRTASPEDQAAVFEGYEKMIAKIMSKGSYSRSR